MPPASSSAPGKSIGTVGRFGAAGTTITVAVSAAAAVAAANQNPAYMPRYWANRPVIG